MTPRDLPPHYVVYQLMRRRLKAKVLALDYERLAEPWPVYTT